MKIRIAQRILSCLILATLVLAAAEFSASATPLSGGSSITAARSKARTTIRRKAKRKARTKLVCVRRGRRKVCRRVAVTATSGGTTATAPAIAPAPTMQTIDSPTPAATEPAPAATEPAPTPTTQPEPTTTTTPQPDPAPIADNALQPQGIPSDCSVDVTARLAAWIASVPDGSTLNFTPNGCYRIDGSLRIEDRFGLVFEGNGATLKAGSVGDINRRHIWIFGGGNLVIRNLTVVGANPNAGTGDAAWSPEHEYQHAFALQGVQGILLDHVAAQDVYGDFVYIGPEALRAGHAFTWSRRVTVQNSVFKRNGRQGISIVAAEDVVISGNYLAGMRRETFDVEPTASHWGARRVKIVNNTTGSGRLLWFASPGQGFNVSDFYIAGNVMLAPMGTPVFKVMTPDDGSGRRRGPFVIEGNTFVVGGSTAAGFECRGCTGLTLRNNKASFPANRYMTAVRVNYSDVTRVTGNAFPGAAYVLKADSRSTDYLATNNTR